MFLRIVSQWDDARPSRSKRACFLLSEISLAQQVVEARLMHLGARD